MVDDENMIPNDNFYQYFEIEYAQTELFVSKWNEIQPEHSDIYVSYDSTNMNTKAQGIEMVEYGHAKEDSDVPQVNISYAVNHRDATPLFYEMYTGSIVDNTQCTHMVDRAKEYGYKNVGIILYRGYFGMGNIRYFDEKIRRKEEMVSYEKLFKLKYDNNGYLESYTKKR